MTKQESDRLIKVLKDAAAEREGSRQKTLDAFVKAGILTPEGNLRKQYKAPKN